MNEYRIEKIDPEIFTKADWNSYYNFRVKSAELKGEPMSCDSMEDLRELNIQNINEHHNEIYAVWKNGIENGILFFDLGHKENPDKRYTYCNNYMNDKHLEVSLLNVIFEKFIHFDTQSKSLIISSVNGLNDHVETMLDTKIASTVEQYELDIKKANLEKINRWLKEVPLQFPNYKIKFHTYVPNENMEEFAAVYSQFLLDMPSNSLLGEGIVTAKELTDVQEAWKLRNYAAYCYLLFNEANELIAHTSVSVNLKDPQELEQLMTGVLKEYRGRGLSKWLKAAMFHKLTTDFPSLKKLETETHPDNHPSRELSKQMGYVRVGAYKDILLKRENIVSYLDSRS